MTRRLKAEGLEAPGEGGRVDDVHAVLALAPSIQRDGDDEQHHRHHAGSQARVQGHVAAVLHTFESLSQRQEHVVSCLLFVCVCVC